MSTNNLYSKKMPIKFQSNDGTNTFILGRKAFMNNIHNSHLPKNLPKKFLMLSYLNNCYFVSSCKKSEDFSHSMARKLQKTLFLGKFGPKIRHFGPKRANKIFFEKSGPVTILTFCSPNLMQKFRTIQLLEIP